MRTHNCPDVGPALANSELRVMFSAANISGNSLIIV